MLRRNTVTTVKLGLTAICAALLFSGCGVREVRSPDGVVTQEMFLGGGELIDCSVDQGHSAKLTHFGLWASPKNAGLGYQQARYFCGSPHCQVTIWAEGGDREALEALAEKHHGICIADKEGD